MRRLAVLLAVCAACHTPDKPPDPVVDPDAQASPQANAQPAPLTAPFTPASGTASPEGGPPPLPLRGDHAIDPDNSFSTKDVAGYTMLATLRVPDMPPVTKAPEVSSATIEAARKENDPRLEIELTATRLRVEFVSGGFLLPLQSEIRARSDRYGHVYVSPDASTYRVLAPGALRALLGERRMDVSPLSPAEVESHGEGSRRLGLKTRRVEVSTRAAKGTFELARVAELGDGGDLLGRALLDLMNAAPSTPLCGQDEVPLHAELRWTTRGAIVFDANAIARRVDLSASGMTVPPPGGTFVAGPLPPTAGELRVRPQELLALHTAALDVGTAAPPPAAGASPRASLALYNGADSPRVVWLDGAPVAWVAPGGRLQLDGLWRGPYQVEWRSFLGDAAEPPRTVIVPGAANLGVVDGGAR